jgi:hypothetical protein
MSASASLVGELRDDLAAMVEDLEIAVEAAIPVRYLPLSDEAAQAIEAGALTLTIAMPTAEYPAEDICGAFGDFNWKLHRLLRGLKARLEATP